MSIEVLAPVGNKEMFNAALLGGADAVFLASKSFGARAYASNFNIEEISEMVATAKLRGVNIHVTVNTLIKENEMTDAIELIGELVKIGVKAIIIQDIGLLDLAANTYKDIEFHCSTQISANNLYAVNTLQKLGADRIILARELSLDEIKFISKNSDVDLEVFGHGSLCVSYSGKCTMSSFIGARSGNRGRCAQPCRKEYELLKPSLEVLGKGFYLSPKDLASKYGAIKLEELGIKSIKIEGRMKKPEYVYGAAKYYKSITDIGKADEFLINEVSNRGFTKGRLGEDRGIDYADLKGNSPRGSEVGIILGDKEKYIELSQDISAQDTLEIQLKNKKFPLTVDKDYKKFSRIVLNKFSDAVSSTKVYRIFNSSLRDNDFTTTPLIDKLPLKMILTAYVGQKPSLEVISPYGKNTVVLDEYIEEGKKITLNYKLAEKQLSKLNDTDFYLKNLILNTDNKSYMPVSSLNNLRRQAVAEMFFRDDYKKSFIKKGFKEIDQSEEKFIRSYRWNKNLIKYNWNSILLSSLEGITSLDNRNIYYELPMVIKDHEYKELEELINRNKNKLKGIVVSNIWDIVFAKKFNDLEVIVSEYANIFNSYSINTCKNLGADRVILSNELSLDDIKGIKKSLDLIVNVYSRPVEMITEHCPASLMGCDFNCNSCRYSKGHLIRSAEGDTYLFNRENHMTKIKNILPIDSRKHLNKLKELGINSFIYDIDNKEDYLVLEGKKINESRKGHFEKGVL